MTFGAQFMFAKMFCDVHMYICTYVGKGLGLGLGLDLSLGLDLGLGLSLGLSLGLGWRRRRPRQVADRWPPSFRLLSAPLADTAAGHESAMQISTRLQHDSQDYQSVQCRSGHTFT